LGEVRREVTIVNKRGLHARAAAKFVKLAGQFNAAVHVAKKDTEVSGLSIMGLMMLAAGTGTTIKVEASGPEAAAVMEALQALVGSGFGEED